MTTKYAPQVVSEYMYRIGCLMEMARIAAKLEEWEEWNRILARIQSLSEEAKI